LILLVILAESPARQAGGNAPSIPDIIYG